MMTLRVSILAAKIDKLLECAEAGWGATLVSQRCELERMTETARRIPQLDGLRGLAILLVLIWHFIVVPATPAHQSLFVRVVAHVGVLTWSGVDLFFVLSGFLIGGILIDAKDSGNYFRTFYIRRIFRILPIYSMLVVGYLLVWTVATGQRTVLQEAQGRPMPWLLYFTFTQNFWLAHHGWDVYLAATWSLAVEEQFYLFLPAIIRMLPRRLLLMAAAALAFGSMTSRSLLYWHYGPSWGTAAYTLFFSRADALMLGVICAVLLRDPRWKALLIRNRWAPQASCAVFGFGVAVFTYRGWGMGTMPMCTLGFTWLALFYASLLILVVIWPDGLLSQAFRARWLMWLGTISYGLYLFHGIVLGALSAILLHPQHEEAKWLVAATTVSGVLASLALAWLSWNYFESRIVRLGHRFIYQKPSPSPPLSVAHAE